MNLLIRCKPAEGYNKIFDVGEYGMKLTKFGLVKLPKGATYESETGETEVALVLIGGNFRASGEGWAFEVTDGNGGAGSILDSYSFFTLQYSFGRSCRKMNNEY